MVGRASVTRELGSPAALPDLTSTQSRRSSSRTSQRTAPVPELNTSNLTQSSYSLPPTPLTSSFDEFLPSAKRRRTQRAIHSEDKTLPSGVTQTPTHRAFSEPFQIPKSRSSSARPARTSNLAQSNTQSSQVQDASLTEADPGTPSSSKSNPPPTYDQPQTAQPQTDQQTIAPGKALTGQKTITVKAESDKAESDKEIPTDTLSTMGAAVSRSRKSRKSMATRVDGLAGQENGTAPSKASVSTPRRDRRSRLAAHTGAKITKPSPASKIQSTPTASTAKNKPQENGAANSATPAKQPQFTTPNDTSTRPRRRGRRSTRATNEQTPSSNQATVNSVSTMTRSKHDERAQSQSPNKRSNTVTLNVGRKSLESILAQQKTYDQEMANMDTPGHAENGDYHFDYDTEMYKNNYGLDGHMDAPTSPTSVSTTTSTAARTSGRTRKPTIRALESLESEKRHRRPRAASAKPVTTTTEASPVKTRSKNRTAQKLPISKSKAARKLDVMIIAKQIYELAAAAVAPDFVPAPEVDTWIKELQQKVDNKEKEKEAVTSPSPEAEAEGGRGSAPPSSNPFLDNVQTSKPWVDGDGWEYTGQTNKHEEEYVIVPPEFEWYRPNNTYGDDELPIPPVRIRSLVQAEKDRAFGYPPRIGERNIPVDNQGFFLFENVFEERTKLKAREAARARGIYVTRFNTFEDLETMINLYDNGQPPVPPAPLAPPILESNAVQAKEPSRKRRRTETTSVSKSTESAEAPKSKRRRQETDNTTPPEESSPPEPGEEDNPSEEKKSLKITLTFGNKRFLLEQAAPGETNGTDQSNNPHSDVEDSASEKASSHNTQSLAVQNTSTTENTLPFTPAKTTDQTENPNTAQVTPGSAGRVSTETTPGGRPRRRAADALMAGFQRHAEDRARRSERARLGHARRRGTPLKTVTGIHGDTVESPIRPAVNPMNLD
ncbi:hypothetical protein BJX76DRAFT_202793 [Aspergillus varians]